MAAVVVRSWVLVVGAGAEHVPDGGEDCPFDRDDGFEFSAAGGDAAILGAQVGVALSGYRHGGGAKSGFEVTVPGPGGGGFASAGGLMLSGTDPGPGA